MPHEIRRVLRAFAAQPWFIEPAKASQIVAALELRALAGPRAEPYRNQAAADAPLSSQQKSVAVLRLCGTILPRPEALEDVSQTAALMTDFQKAFQAAATDPNVAAIVLDIDSPGGRVDQIPETAAMIRAAHSEDRPIIAVANTLAASAAYWIASAADEIVVSPSGQVGSIGAYVLHEDISEALAQRGVRMQFISEGPRKTETSPFEPLSDEARQALQEFVRSSYDQFVADVAKGRGVSASVVRADPEKGGEHFGGGRTYHAKQAIALGMADRIDTLDNTIARLQRGKGRRGRKATSARRRLALS